MHSLKLALATAALAAAGTALAEDTETVLSQVDGSVLVNQGEAYEAAQEGMALSAGDQLLLMEGASAQVSFAAGCVKDPGANEILRVPENDTACLDGAATFHQMGSGSGVGMGELIAGGLIFAGGAWFIIDGDDDPVPVPEPQPPISP